MEEGRTYTIQKKPTCVLAKKMFMPKNIGEQGQALIKGTIIGDSLEFAQDDVEHIIKRIKITSFERIENKQVRK